MLVDGVVIGGSVDRSGNVPLHVGDFFGAFVDEEQDELRGGMVGVNALGDVLHQDRLAGSRWGDDQSALAEADGGENIDGAGGQLGGAVLELDHRLRIEGGGIIECGAIVVFVRCAAFDGVDLSEGTAARYAGHEQAGAQVQLADHLTGDGDSAAHRSKRKKGVAQLAVLTLVGDVEYPLQLACKLTGHSKSM